MKKNDTRGLTLIEILIVVIIIAVIAAMALPRMIKPIGRAEIAEAEHALGTIRRAQIRYMSLTQSGPYGVEQGGNWKPLGMSAPVSAKFTYKCEGNDCKATTTANAAASGNIILNILTGVYSCDGNYTLVDATKNSRGCMPAA